MATDIAARGLVSKSCRTSSTMSYQTYRKIMSPYRAYWPCGGNWRSIVAGVVDEHKLLRDIEKLLKKEIPPLRFRGMSRTRQSKPNRSRTSPATWRRSWTGRWSRSTATTRAESGAKSGNAKPAEKPSRLSAMPNRQANNNVAAVRVNLRCAVIFYAGLCPA